MERLKGASSDSRTCLTSSQRNGRNPECDQFRRAVFLLSEQKSGLVVGPEGRRHAVKVPQRSPRLAGNVKAKNKASHSGLIKSSHSARPEVIENKAT